MQKCKAIERYFKIYNFYLLDTQNMIWITKDKEFINGLQQQNRKDFVNGLQKWAPNVQNNNKSGGPNLQTLPS